MDKQALIEILMTRRDAVKRYKNTYDRTAIEEYQETLTTKELLGRYDEKLFDGLPNRLLRIYQHAYSGSQDLLNLPLKESNSDNSVTRLFKASYFDATLTEYGQLIEALEKDSV